MLGGLTPGSQWVASRHYPCQTVIVNEHAFFWTLPALVAVAIFVQLRSGTIRLYQAPKEWRFVEKEKDEGRYWLFIVAEGLLVLILIGQALSV